jgi:hypothetical protein
MIDSDASSAPRDDAAKQAVKKRGAKSARRNGRKRSDRTSTSTRAVQADYPRHALKKALRIPRAILEQNAGHACTAKESAEYCKVGFAGPYQVELSSATKYGYLDRSVPGKVAVTPLARRILRPTSPSDELSALRTAFLKAPQFGALYKHFRGENIPDEPFLSNTLTDTFHVPAEKVPEFKTIFSESLDDAKLVEKRGDSVRILDVSEGEGVTVDSAKAVREQGKTTPQQADSCFVMMPFGDPIGTYYKKLYEPAIEKAGLRPIRADDDIFTVGKIIDQVLAGIATAKVLLAELTGRNPNVLYELGIAHALQKPVVLVASNEADVPFDIRHRRVIYYDRDDPFWGDKLIKKVAENIVSAINNPDEAILRPETGKT